MVEPIGTLLPFYAVCDVSASMRDEQRIDALNTALATVCDATATHPVVADRVRLGILSFASEARLALQLSDWGSSKRCRIWTHET